MINNKISAKTKVFAVLGDPIGHSMSPLIQNTIADMNGTDMVYHALHVRPEDLGAAIKGGEALGISGFNITVPHKKAVMQYLCGIDKAALAIGAVNTLKLTENGYVGYNTDAIGAYYALKTNGVEIKDKTVAVLGAGGAGNACAAMALSRGAKTVYILNRTLDTANGLCMRLNEHFNITPEFGKDKVCALELRDIYDIYADIVINCTTLGFADKADMTPVENTKWFKQAKVEAVLDAVYSPWETRLLREAGEQGIKAINGFPMLVYQAAAAQEIWFDTEFTPEFRADVCKKLTDFYLKGNE